ncbi:hypothetical protein [Microcoleus sp. S13_C5]|uniref:hypothetical protein n=1 Tax=Microcoleus sp. S13_C5 TaxID=3055411 RepID=UPI002FD40660
MAKKRNFLISENRGILSDSIHPARNADENLAFCLLAGDVAATPVSDEAGFSLTASWTNRSPEAGRESRQYG